METLIVRFKEFLIEAFRQITPTKEAATYRKQLLNLLVDTASGYKAKGIEDEDLLFEMSVASLGDLNKTLYEFDKKNRRNSINVIGLILAFFLVSTVVYLIASFATAAWSKTWLTFIYAIAIFFISIGVYGIARGASRHSEVRIRLNIYMIVAMLFITVYLSVLMLASGFTQSWTLFLYMIIAMLGADLITCVFLRSKTTWLVLMGFIQCASTLLYVTLGVMHIVPWSPYWLMPVIGLVINILCGAFLICRKVKGCKKRERDIDKKYYTDWD